MANAKQFCGLRLRQKHRNVNRCGGHRKYQNGKDRQAAAVIGRWRSIAIETAAAQQMFRSSKTEQRSHREHLFSIACSISEAFVLCACVRDRCIVVADLSAEPLGANTAANRPNLLADFCRPRRTAVIVSKGHSSSGRGLSFAVATIFFAPDLPGEYFAIRGY